MLAAGKGDLQAFEQLIRAHQRSAWCAAYRFLGDAAEAEDVVQDAFLKILDAAPRYKPTATFRTYLYRVVTRLCIDRKQKKKPVYTSDLPHEIDSHSSPSKHLEIQERENRVRAALDILPPKQRMAVILKYYEDLRYAEIADVLNVSQKAVERLLARARTSLQAILSR